MLAAPKRLSSLRAMELRFKIFDTRSSSSPLSGSEHATMQVSLKFHCLVRCSMRTAAQHACILTRPLPHMSRTACRQNHTFSKKTSGLALRASPLLPGAVKRNLLN